MVGLQAVFAVGIARTAARTDTIAISSILVALGVAVVVAAARLAVGSRSW
jgi:hypothetical protein